MLPLNRGLAASPSAKTDVLALIEQLERLNPTPEPNESTLLTGEWKLLYTNALDVLSLGLLAPIALVSEVFQNVFEAPEDKGYDYDIKNIVQLEPSFAPVSNAFFGRTWTSVTVSATGIKKSSSRVDITFVDSVIKPESVAGFDVPDVLPPFRIRLGSPVGYIETTFLDEDIRVARAPPGSIQGENLFVLLRVQ